MLQKRLRPIGLLTLGIVLALGLYSYSTRNVLRVHEVNGIVVRLDNVWGDQWGIENSFALTRPWARRYVRVKNLPPEFRVPGVQVRYSYVRGDLIADDKWGLSVSIVAIRHRQ